jgi:hypothetical protein
VARFPAPTASRPSLSDRYKESELIYVARVRHGFVPATRRQIFDASAIGAARLSVRQSARNA